MAANVAYGTGSAAIGANTALYIPIVIPWPYPMKRFWVYNGTTVSGNIDIGLYSRTGARLISTGSFAQAGASAVQYRSASYLIPPGAYYLAIAADAGGTAQRWIYSVLGAQIIGLLQQTATFPLPAAATFATTTASYKLFGLTLTESGF